MKPVTPANPQLLGDIRQLIESSRSALAVTVNSALTQLYWHIGQRLRNEVLNNQRAGYGEHIVSTLARQLETDFGRGFSAKNLRHMLRFAEVFDDPEIVSAVRRQLSWTHIKTLIYIDDPLKRDFYLQMCQQERWSTRTLQEPNFRHSRVSGNLGFRALMVLTSINASHERSGLASNGDRLTSLHNRRSLHHSRELSVLGLNGDGKPFTEANHEATSGLHPRQQTQRHTLYRRHQQFNTANLAAQQQPYRRFYSKIPSSPIVLFRAIPRHGYGYITGKTTQKMEPCLENRTHRKNQSSMAGFVVRGYRITPKIAPFLQKPSSPRKRGSRITGQTGTHWIPTFAGMTEQIERLELDASGIQVAEYLTELPPKALLQQKLHEAITCLVQVLGNTKIPKLHSTSPSYRQGLPVSRVQGCDLSFAIHGFWISAIPAEMTGDPFQHVAPDLCSEEA